jgi:TRAP-type transport system periplasmic protein
MKRFLVSLIAGFFLVSLLLLGVTTPLLAQSGKVRELTFSTYTPPTHQITKDMISFCKEIEQATDGQIKVAMYPSGTLTKADQVFDGVVKGISDFGFAVNSYTPRRFPLMEVTELPIPVTSSEKMSQVCLATYKKFQPKEFSPIKLLGFLSFAGGIISSNKPIYKFADLKGLLLRCTASDVDLVKAIGATPVAKPVTEGYEMLQRGVVDGEVGDYGTIMTYKTGEVLKYHVEYSFRCLTTWYGMNLKTYNSLTPAQQKIITDLGEKYTTIMGQDRDADNKKGRDYVIGLGNKLIKIPAEEEQKWAASLLPLYDKYVTEKTAMGLPAREALDFVLKAVK